VLVEYVALLLQGVLDLEEVGEIRGRLDADVSSVTLLSAWLRIVRSSWKPAATERWRITESFASM
jgi:hypothetical protein